MVTVVMGATSLELRFRRQAIWFLSGGKIREDIDLGRLAKTRERIRRAIESRLMTAHQKYGLPLRKNLGGHWKFRVGDYRVVFKVEGEVVHVLGIRHRKNIYEDVTGRIK